MCYRLLLAARCDLVYMYCTVQHKKKYLLYTEKL